MAQGEGQAPEGAAKEGGAPAKASAGKKPDGGFSSVISRTMPDGRIMIGQDIEIFPGKELPYYASPGTKSYEAKDQRQPYNQFALLCDTNVIPRVTILGSYKGMKNPNI